jgi:iron(III) transport system ATP-binding protein
MRAELKNLQRKLGITTIYVTHDQEEANAIADRMAVLASGVIQQVGPPIDLYDRPANRFVAGFLGSVNLIEGRIENGRFVADGITLAGVGGTTGVACLAIRPQDISLADADATLEATVTASEFLGGLTRYRMRAACHELTFDVPHRRNDETYAAGTKLRLHIDPRRVTLLR